MRKHANGHSTRRLKGAGDESHNGMRLRNAMPPDERLIALVKFLARRAAEHDFRKLQDERQ